MADPSQTMLEQAARQEAMTRAGVSMIGKIFHGGTYGVDPAQTWDPHGQYYDSGGGLQSFDMRNQNPGYLSFQRANQKEADWWGKGGTPGWGAYLRQMYNRGLLFNKTDTSPGFDENFYKGVGDKYTQFAMSGSGGLNDQFTDASRQVSYRLANQGLWGSSPADTLKGSLSREYAKQQENIANTGFGLSSNLRQNVANQEATLVSQVQAGMDPQTAGLRALQSASQFRVPSAMAPVGNMLSDWANMYAMNQSANMYNNSNPYAMWNAPKGNVGNNVGAVSYTM